jgi:hypothetical protein
MSIDARVTAVTQRQDGTAVLHLEPRDERVAPAGQTRLVVENPTPGLAALVGREVWGNDARLMLGERHFADRIGYTRLRLVGGEGK